jgi:Phage integrase, N-terminal SAM-like domain
MGMPRVRAVKRGPVTQKRPGLLKLPEALPLSRFSAADDLRAAIGLWAGWLAGERRASAHTVAAYGRDLAFFLDFLTEHLGEPPSLAAINDLLSNVRSSLYWPIG